MLRKKIFLVGMMGSGKSYWGRHLGNHFKVPFFDTDNLIEEQKGKKISEIFEKEGEDAFRILERDILLQYPWPPVCIVACGGGLPAFQDNMDIMLAQGSVIWLNPPLEGLSDRLMAEKDHRPMIAASSNKESLYKRLSSLLEVRSDYFRKANIVLNQSHPSLDQIIEILAKHGLVA